MAKTLKARPYGAGKYTEAQFKAHIVSGLRKLSRWWPPKTICKQEARVGLNRYQCAGPCKEVVDGTHRVVGKIKKQAYVFADHIEPAVDPNVGWQGFDVFIARLFVEKEGYQLLCLPCHAAKTREEKDIAKARVAKEKKENES